MEAIIISDLHLGAKNSNTEAIQVFLDSISKHQKLILNGDVLDSIEAPLNKKHWKILLRLSKFRDLIWIKGNHDKGCKHIAELINVTEIVDEYVFESNSKKICCIHGDSWDDFLIKYPVIVDVADWIYSKLQNIDSRLAKIAKKQSKTYVRCLEKIKQGALSYAKSKNYDIIICGHTHHPEYGYEYVNSGCWTDRICTYVSVQDGACELHNIDSANYR